MRLFTLSVFEREIILSINFLTVMIQLIALAENFNFFAVVLKSIFYDYRQVFDKMTLWKLFFAFINHFSCH